MVAPAGRNVVTCLSSNRVGNVNPGVTRGVCSTFNLATLSILSGRPRELLSVSNVDATGLGGVYSSCLTGENTHSIITFLAPRNVAPGETIGLCGRCNSQTVSVIGGRPCRLYRVTNVNFGATSHVTVDVNFSRLSMRHISRNVLCTLASTRNGKRLYVRGRTFVGTYLGILSAPRLARSVITGHTTHLICDKGLMSCRKGICHDGATCTRDGLTRLLSQRLHDTEDRSCNSLSTTLSTRRLHVGIGFTPRRHRTIGVTLARNMSIVANNPNANGSVVLHTVLSVCHHRGPNGRVYLYTPAKHTTEQVRRTAKLKTSAIRGTLKLLTNRSKSCKRPRTLSTSVVLISRISVVSVCLTKQLLRTIGSETRIILVNSSSRLPSINPNTILDRVVTDRHVPIIELSGIFHRGSNDQVTIGTGLVERNGLDLRCNGSFEFISSTGLSSSTDHVTRLCVRRITECNMSGITVLSPCQRGARANIGTLGRVLQRLMGPPSRKGPRIMYNGQGFHINSGIVRIGGFRSIDGNSVKCVHGVFGFKSRAAMYMSFNSNEGVRCSSSRLSVLSLKCTSAVRGTRNTRCRSIVVGLRYTRRVVLAEPLVCATVAHNGSEIVVINRQETLYVSVGGASVRGQKAYLTRHLRRLTWLGKMCL